LEILEIYVVALYQDLVIGILEILSLVPYSLHNTYTLAIIRIIMLFSRGAFSQAENNWSENPETLYWLKVQAIMKPLALHWRMAGLA